MEKEIRSQTESEFEVEYREDGGVNAIKGYGIVFEKRSVNLGGFLEVIDKKAMEGADVSDVVGLFNHDRNYVLGRTTSGTMKLEVTGKGVRYHITPPDTQFARDLAVSIKRGDISGSSFAFTIAYRGDEWSEDENGVMIRRITKFNRILDMSPVTYPAYPDTTVASRSLNEFKTLQFNPNTFNARSRELALLTKY